MNILDYSLLLLAALVSAKPLVRFGLMLLHSRAP